MKTIWLMNRYWIELELFINFPYIVGFIWSLINCDFVIIKTTWLSHRWSWCLVWSRDEGGASDLWALPCGPHPTPAQSNASVIIHIIIVIIIAFTILTNIILIFFPKITLIQKGVTHWGQACIFFGSGISQRPQGLGPKACIIYMISPRSRPVITFEKLFM